MKASWGHVLDALLCPTKSCTKQLPAPLLPPRAPAQPLTAACVHGAQAAAGAWSGGGRGLQGLLARNHKQRPFVIVRRVSAQAAPQGGRELVHWVQQNGGSVQGVAVQEWGGEGEAAGFGLRALQDCRAGSCLISLPRSCHLTYDGTADPRLLALIEQVPQELWGAKLALQVLAHRVQGEASPFATYIANLPVGVPGLPMFFNGEALAVLQYPPVTEQVKRRCRWLLQFSQQVLAPVNGTQEDPFGGAAIDANALGWALGVVTSRAFRTRGPSAPASALPLVDMANHSFSPNCKIAAAGSGDLQMVATRDLAAGEQILLSYGNLSNDFLLMDYGFIVPGNPYDTVQLRFDPGLVEAAKAVAGVGSSSSPSQDAADVPAWQQAALHALGLAGEGANTEVSILQVRSAPNSGSSSDAGGGGGAAPGGEAAASSSDGGAAAVTAAAATAAAESAAGSSAGCPVDPRLLAGVRVLCAKNAGEISGRSPQELGDWSKPLSGPSELAALRTLSGLCLIALSQFTTSLQDDEAALAADGAAGGAGDPLPPDMRLALRFRAEKKRLLLNAVAVVSARVKELQAGEGRQPEPAGQGGKGKVPAAKHGGKGFGR